MEKILFSWIISKNDIETTNSLKIISDNGLFITIESLEKFFQPFLSPLNLFENDTQKEKKLKYGLKTIEIMNLYEMLKNLITTNRGKKPNKNYFVYSFRDPMFNELLNDYNTPSSNVTSLPIFIICLDILRNNKNQLIKPKLENSKTIIIAPPTQIISKNDNNYNNNNEIDNSIPFFKIWRNSVLRGEIISEIKILNNHLGKFTFYSINEMEKYKYKNYLNHVVLDFKKVMDKNLFRYEGDMFNNYFENCLPPCIKSLEINGGFNFFIKPCSFPTSLTYLQFETDRNNNKIGEKNVILNYPVNNQYFKNFKNLKIVKFGEDFHSSINENSIPEGIKNVEFKNDFSDFLLLNSNIFPKTLKSLTIGSSNINKSNTNNYDTHGKESSLYLPKTITSLNYYGNSILPNLFLNESLTRLNIKWPKNHLIKKENFPQRLKYLTLEVGKDKDIKKNSFPTSIIKLKLCNYNKIIEPDVLPKNLEYLSFKDTISNNRILLKKYQPTLIKGSLPITLKTLKLGEHHLYMDVLIKGVLTPSHTNLTILSVVIRNPIDYKLSSLSNILKVENDIMERSIKWRKNKFIPESLKLIICKTNLQYPLLFNLFHSSEPNNNNNNNIAGIPTIVKLDEDCRDDITPISMVKSLTSLKLNDSFDKIIYITQLPNSLLHLNFGCTNSIFTKNIITNSIPIGLKTLILPPFFDGLLNIDEHFPNLEILVIGLSNPSNVLYDPLKSLKLKFVFVFNENNNFLFNHKYNNIKTILEPILKIIPLKQFKKINK
ncbi:hypothetical protein DDB_G0268362 [Dictyostelium discoideum AX4]|uniref:Uncharacterized protein n=1 Tax=Dictyostelium discoideum TaxID=44689 RepID=Q55G24_DICDI|nr:hypothetical protein DDB_G0268362 [Dictyostelium discoideum AX4]EAL73634.1 hypothetical protein DDB_G0268362 [Dictyostelium discoideum AX4]|eukprot:XP_647359.1 hypothetical protein DDB_G0268362 [Dictyostelium discoideum AX4]